MPTLLLGQGQTAQSCIRFFEKHSIPFIQENPDWNQITQVVKSPGLDWEKPELKKARELGIPIIGDIELFAQQAKAPIIAITGTYGKSTVTTLITELLNASGKTALMGGNIGIPALDLLDQPVPDYYVLELSSFQLETTYSLKAEIAILLNIAPNHLDHHGTMEAYSAAKLRIFNGCKYALTAPVEDFPGLEEIVSPALSTKHQLSNVRVALKTLSLLNIPLDDAQKKVLANFKGLPYRCQFVREFQGIRFFNDSKGTTIGATIAAIEGIAQDTGRLFLLLGGQGKGQDFTALKPTLEKHVYQIIVFGQDKALITEALSFNNTILAETLLEDLERISPELRMGDQVLLSPACASWDQFKDYMERGKVFDEWVNRLQTPFLPQ